MHNRMMMGLVFVAAAMAIGGCAHEKPTMAHTAADAIDRGTSTAVEAGSAVASAMASAAGEYAQAAGTRLAEAARAWEARIKERARAEYENASNVNSGSVSDVGDATIKTVKKTANGAGAAVSSAIGD